MGKSTARTKTRATRRSNPSAESVGETRMVSRFGRMWQAIAGGIRNVLEFPVGLTRRDDPLASLYHESLPPRLQWNWWAVVFGPFWYFAKGLWVHGVILVSIVFLSGGVLLPFVWLYAGLKANEDLLEFRVARRSYY